MTFDVDFNSLPWMVNPRFDIVQAFEQELGTTMNMIETARGRRVGSVGGWI
jgi:hypothetical protein